jgi:hypothetical protein
VADRGLFRIDFGFIGDVTAVAPSIDLHDPILYRLSNLFLGDGVIVMPVYIADAHDRTPRNPR